jgi:UDP-N-acetylmuramoyl-L-alanyl-D-glutamate--2,6-diaminopimelate ligase
MILRTDMRIKELIPGAEIIKGDTNIKVESCVTEPKDACDSAALFVIPSVSFDTYSIAEKFARAKARVLITEDSSRFPKCKIPIIEVRCVRRAYAFAISALTGIDYGALTFIGVTGTNGKTSTATILEHILTACGRKVAFIGTGKMRFGGKE